MCSIFCRHPIIYKSAYFGEGNGSILLDDIDCFGHESEISLCTNGGWGMTKCQHGDDVGINCGNYMYTTHEIYLYFSLVNRKESL